MQTKITFNKAQSLLNAQKIKPLGTERVFLYDSLGRILATDICAPTDMPTAPLSNMDGYAIHSSFRDSKTFKILGKNPAGNTKTPSLPLNKPCAIQTFTGAKIPENADTLIPIEHTIIQGKTLKVTLMPKTWQFIRGIGTNYKKGEKLLKKGTKINANHIGLLASLNCVFVEVFERSKVGILVSGNELLELGQSPTDSANLYNTNGHLLVAKVRENGGIPKLYPILKDNQQEIKNTLTLALQECDMVISSGGASVGDYDFIAKICAENPKDIIFAGVQIKPGQHIFYARFYKKHFFGLPGFPNSTLTTFELFAKKILQRLNGAAHKHIVLKIPLSEDVVKNDTRLEFRICNVRNCDGYFTLDFKGKKDFQSAILNNFCPLDDAQNGLCILESSKKAGEIVEVILL